MASIDRRKDILTAATKSFSQFGYKATTMDQVAKMANVGKGTIYTFFTNKEELFDQIITTLISDMKEQAEKSICNDASFQENVHIAIFNMLEFRKEHQLTIKLFQEGREIGTPIVLDVIKKLEDTILSFITEKVKKAIERGVIKECDPEITAFILLKLYIALIFDWEQRKEPLGKEQIADLIDLYVIKGLSAR